VSPRELLTGFVGTLVQVEGIVTKCAPAGAAAPSLMVADF
jgi:DNA replicative helicase MCM subunit Mcm2 (Cdc46/Mcm family)